MQAASSAFCRGLGPYIANGNYNKEMAKQAIAEEKVDFVAFGRPYIANPDLLERYKKMPL